MNICDRATRRNKIHRFATIKEPAAAPSMGARANG